MPMRLKSTELLKSFLGNSILIDPEVARPSLWSSLELMRSYRILKQEKFMIFSGKKDSTNRDLKALTLRSTFKLHSQKYIMEWPRQSPFRTKKKYVGSAKEQEQKADKWNSVRSVQEGVSSWRKFNLGSLVCRHRSHVGTAKGVGSNMPRSVKSAEDIRPSPKTRPMMLK